jgi:hypothetical protein
MGEQSSKRRLQVRLPAELFDAAEGCANNSGVSLGSFVRLLIEDALTPQPRTVTEALTGRGDVDGRIAMLAGLVASENAVLAVEKILPPDRLDTEGLRAEAIARAERRLADVRRHVEREQQ